MAITHKFWSPIDDGADIQLVRPSNWNEDHAISAVTPAKIIVPFASPNIDASLGNTFTLMLTGDVTLTISNSTEGQLITVHITQDSSGNHSVTWPTSFKGAMDIQGIAKVANAVITQSFNHDGTYWRATGVGTVT